ncbi:MAG TPA: preprotein translocase subunit SecA [Treponemataceae bacterium]|nr:preprotein translocase subunit SecA [Treponemataceae bacterium]
MLDSILKALFGTKNQRDLKALYPILEKVNQKEEWAKSFTDDEYPKQTEILKKRLKNGETLDDILPEAFALAREVSFREIGERPYDVQVMGAIVLHSGRITEMKTGEGKTLTTVLPSYLNALSGKGVHVITTNEYLTERNAEWMRPIYQTLGVSVGIVLSNLDNESRKKAYNCDITYGTNNELGFDYLRDNMQISSDRKVQKSFSYAIIDEIDSILIDEARTPLIISGQGEDDTAKFFEVDKYVGQFDEVEKNPDTGFYPDETQGEKIVGDYTIDEKSKRVSFSDSGMNKIETILKKQNLIEGSVFDEENFEYIHYFTQAIRAHELYTIDVDYVVKDRQVQIVDEFTGRILEGRRYGDGLHQAIEAKEHIHIAQRNRTLATITFQNFFRMYEKLSGMTGTAATEEVEFSKIYELEVVVVPTNEPIARIDENDEVYMSEADKWNAIANEIVAVHKTGQPILVGTVSIEKSELLSSILTKRGVRHEVLNAKNHAREAYIIAEAGAKGSVTISTNMAGRGTDIKLGGNPEYRARKKAGTEASEEKFQSVFTKEKAKHTIDYEEIKRLGGLYVIGTERHESRRIDNQLRGRSGRQGDPGKSKFYISMDDELMRLFGGERMKNIMKRIGMEAGEPIYHPMLTKGIERAQSKVEERNFEIRKHLLEYDDVLNEQRHFMYNQRDQILEDEHLLERILTTAEEELDSVIKEYDLRSRKNEKDAFSTFATTLKDLFNYTLSIDIDRNTMQEKILAELKEDLNEKSTLAGTENLNMFIRYQYVQEIDKKWLDHLETLEALREAVALRSYGSKNPLTEYKIDGFNIFYDMLDDIRIKIAERVFKVQIRDSKGRDVQERMRKNPAMAKMSASHNKLGAFSDRGAGMAQAARSKAQNSAMASKRDSENTTIRRTSPKVGRNDPCPCGSNKKYKKCCGR